ncbi:MAG TPA: preprotein translocase subunit SecA [Verrucomicrobia bacterium]|nr:MAG: preprotein translocase subunit SecA [Lentisphaerae bacterium GWF2_57_35]HBA84193.1 preprotein translocase subunit SecA [Verrucomicrobiota bacterium]
MQWFLKKIVGTKNERDLKKLRPLVDQINVLEVECQKLTDDALKAKTLEFKHRLTQGQTVDDLLCEAFAVVKNACRRLVGTTANVCGHPLTWDMVPFDTQLIGGLALHQGKIAEMATGEGKTLVATLPVYLNALTGKNVNVVTVNDYLAKRDSEWMGTVYKYLGLTVGCIQNDMDPEQRRAEYAKDITYGTNSEFGFDYLRDKGMAHRPEEQVQRGYFYAIIDEVDSILVDEARTPLIISGPAPYSTHQYHEVKPAVDRLVRRQRDLCAKLVQEAGKLIEEGKESEAQLKLYQVHHGMPKNKQFLHMLEEPKIRRLLEKIDGSMLTDMRKEEARELRQELYFTIDEKGNDASLTEKGCETLNPNEPEYYVMPDLVSQLAELDGDESLTEEQKFEKRQALQNQFADRSERIHAVDQLIRAYCVYEKDVEYVVQNNQVIIVDEFTGRLMPGRRWSDGLHQAVEAKEGVEIERETQTLATITIQNYFRMYEKLAGMTGTAETEADEFHEIYKLDVVVIPTNRPVRRVDNNDMIYKTQREKFNAIAQEISDCYVRKQPVLVGTISVETSELLSRMLRRLNIPHNVLNAKNHQREAEIVSLAGQAGAVTIATNMAGRGTDIKLGEGVVYIERDMVKSKTRLEDKVNGKTLRNLLLEKPCGLHVIGSERHESRRIDRQLRGRCARQGDPGSSRFYVSLEDDLMRLFGSDRIAGIMEKLGIQEGEVLEHPWLNRSIETAQRRVEQQNFSIRKRTLEYDDVMNKQREIIYGFRSEVVGSAHVREHLYSVVEDVIQTKTDELAGSSEENLTDLIVWANSTFPVGIKGKDLAVVAKKGEDLKSQVAARIVERVKKAYELKVRIENPDTLNAMERYIILQAVDSQWQEYLRNMDTLRQGVGLRAYGQRDPLVEYKHEAYSMFSDLMDRIKAEVAQRMFRSTTSPEAFRNFLAHLPQMYVHDEVSALGHRSTATPEPAAAAPSRAQAGAEAAMQAALNSKATPFKRDDAKVGRNDPCPCGSGKKYKKCCGAGL